MNRFVKKNINRLLYRSFRVVKNNRGRATLSSIVSKIFINPLNSLEYDEAFDMFWQKSGYTYLQLDSSPKYDFSYKKYKKRFNSMFTRKYSLNSGDIVLDLGAGIGAELPFYVERIKEKGQVYAIEASPDSFKKLEVFCNKNNFGNSISLHNVAISDMEGSVWIEETDLYKANQINEEAKGVEVVAVTLDQFVAQHNISKINLLKMNIEGAELQVINGMGATIDLVENFAISCHDFLFKEKKHIKEKVKSYFEGHGFIVEEIATGNKYIDSWIYGRKKND